jgi:hypothetical protein
MQLLMGGPRPENPRLETTSQVLKGTGVLARLFDTTVTGMLVNEEPEKGVHLLLFARIFFRRDCGLSAHNTAMYRSDWHRY